jgi:phosphopentomutase
VKRVFVIVLDGVGVGELPDAGRYGDEGSDTLGNLSRAVGGLNLPNLEKLGLACIHPVEGLKAAESPQAAFGKMAEKSPGKDSTTGHWELGGLILNQPFPTYPNGFPDEIICEFTSASGYGVIGNYPASGTEIIKELGEEHIWSRKLIVYTSADSVFQIAAHEKIVPVDELYRICQIARDLLTGEHGVARVIARPFTGENSADFQRTKYRRDFSLKPPDDTTLKRCQKSNIPTVGIGKINDLYAFDGIDKNVITKTNEEGMAALEHALDEEASGLIMANLVDFDMLWGHRNEPRGFQKGLESFDKWLGGFLDKLKVQDILFITADHGNDPTTPGTDHSREYVPLIIHGQSIKNRIDLGIRSTFADLDATIADYLDVAAGPGGKSFLQLICNF